MNKFRIFYHRPNPQALGQMVIADVTFEVDKELEEIWNSITRQGYMIVNSDKFPTALVPINHIISIEVNP